MCCAVEQNLLPVKEETPVEPDAPASSEQKPQPGCSALNVSVDSALERRRRRHSGDDSTRDSSPGSERGSRGGPAVTDRALRGDRMVLEERDTRESSPVSDHGSRAAAERSLRDRASVGIAAREQLRLRRGGDVNGTASSSASTCSEDSELRINDFLGNV